MVDTLYELAPGTRIHIIGVDTEGDDDKVNEFTIPKGKKDRRSDFFKRLSNSVISALEQGNGYLNVALDNGEEFWFTEHHACPRCSAVFFEMAPNMFSFNSPDGMCPECNGLGAKLNVDPHLIVTDPDISLLDGASPWYGELRKVKPSGNWMRSELFALADHMNVDLEKPWKKLPKKFQEAALFGTGDEIIHWKYDMKKRGRAIEFERPVSGAVNNIKRLLSKTDSEGVRKALLVYFSEQPCPVCKGERLSAEARFVTIGSKRFPEVAFMTIGQLHKWTEDVLSELTNEDVEISTDVLNELRSRLRSALDVGLHYLSLDRSAPTLSGGEGQRLRLATQLGSGLSDLFYVLDEPSIGLHPRDHEPLIDTLAKLRDDGNTVLVVEHDTATMMKADWLIDLGPGAGVHGGEVVAAGTPEQVMKAKDSLTGQYLSGKVSVKHPHGRKRKKAKGWLTLHGARLHNLKDIDVKFPLGVLTCVTGVSGSGKSSLVAQTLSPALSDSLHGEDAQPGQHKRLDGEKKIDKVINVTQKPIGRTPRSNPGTYVEVFDEIRKLFAGIPEAKARKYKANRFSFNSKQGRCEACEGLGQRKVEMHFLPDVWVTCTECDGQRYNRETLEIKYNGKTIAEVLDMDVQEALELLKDQPDVERILGTLADVGLEYIKLGQSALTLSGGEAQRVKLAKELGREDTGNTLYILDEPTTGLHFADIQKLLDVLHRLTEAGNTVIVTEHNMDVVKTADWVIDLGPEGGDEGGYIVVEGTPEKVAKDNKSHTGRFLKDYL
jgi:excinuclease ABC subunit A